MLRFVCAPAIPLPIKVTSIQANTLAKKKSRGRDLQSRSETSGLTGCHFPEDLKKGAGERKGRRVASFLAPAAPLVIVG